MHISHTIGVLGWAFTTLAVWAQSDTDTQVVHRTEEIPVMGCVHDKANAESTTLELVIEEDFDGYEVGPVPVGEWSDVIDRVGTPTIPAPKAMLIETAGPDGELTQAIQTVGAFGNSSGIYHDIASADVHWVSVDVRVDQFANPNQGWPIGLGFAQSGERADINQNPHAVVYAWTSRVWSLFITQGLGHASTDVEIPMPALDLNTWYTIALEVNTETGLFSASVSDASTGELLGSATHQFINWNPERGDYDAIAFFDSEIPGATSFGQATLDRVEYRAATASKCAVDLTDDGVLDFFDVSAFVDAFANDHPIADITKDNRFDFFDVSAFLAAFAKGCP